MVFAAVIFKLFLDMGGWDLIAAAVLFFAFHFWNNGFSLVSATKESTGHAPTISGRQFRLWLIAVATPFWLAPTLAFLIMCVPFPLSWGQTATQLNMVFLFVIPAIASLGLAAMYQFQTGGLVIGAIYYPVAWGITLVLGFLGSIAGPNSGSLY